MPSIVFGKGRKDSLILGRIYQYQQEHVADIDSVEDNVYMKFRFNVEKRNPSLWLIPSIYVLAKGERQYIRESYNKVTFADAHHYDINSQVLSGTVRKNRSAMPTLLDLATPNIYDIALYDGRILSPFNKTNRRFYKYEQRLLNTGETRLEFRPKLYNTQLVNGYAIIDTETGRIDKTVMNGEFDMITFRTDVQQGEHGAESLMPIKCVTAATFRFLGNRISSLFDATYHNNFSLPDSIKRITSRALLDSIRPVPLSETDKLIYARYDEKHRPDTTSHDTIIRSGNILKKIFWDTIGDHLVTPIKAESNAGYLRLSPIINPLYLSYSHHRGVAYKMRLRSRYTFSAHRYMTFNPTFGYNFKIKQFYFTAPLRITYNPKRNGYAEVVYGNGNRISNSSVEQVIHQEYGDSIDFTDKDVDKFNDNHLRVFNNIMLFNWLDVEAGIIYHRRHAVNKDMMRQYQMPTMYRSFAPMLGLKILPWEKGPLFSFDWERSIKGVYGSNIDYERWEIDGSWKHRLPGLRILNLRLGGGIYTRKAQNYFVDFSNFRDDNLPEGWDDDWSGDFQLLRSREYNSSNYYLRGNTSYESPMMIATWIPYLGKYIEKERFYISSVLLERSRPYFELGYGFTNRYISVGAFAAFRNSRFQEVGVEFEFELFRRW